MPSENTPEDTTTVVPAEDTVPASVFAKRFWFAHVVMLLAVAASIVLATWQFEVWKDTRRAQQHDVSGLPPIALTEVIKPGQGFPGNDIGRPVIATGTWMPEATFYVHNGKGYNVVTPIMVRGAAIPVLRGWSRTQSGPSVPAERVSITGWLEPSDESDPVQVSPKLYRSLSLAVVAQSFDVPLYSGYVAARTANSGLDGLTQNGPSQTTIAGADFSTGLRNFLYGVQWWLFAALAIYLWWKWLRDQRQPVSTEEVASTSS